ncbi:TPA: type 1 fimbrial protein [Escherichia coli]|nr:type 1 fimbrial protein [Escherichia coli]HAZ3503165.1 type 1 fimbrial protein [Escherichia coli]HAZ3652597.1 type 1 fimbrial protein [Escherichia coli]HAZ3670690.1 type 1 fimbrial protein [Escherichia coli]HBA8216090.1 type 1 fimbrial protein [Escherichia coli]
MKKALLAMVLASLVVGTANAASGDFIGSAQQTINGSIVNSTCTIEFPADYTFPPVSRSAWDATTTSAGVVTELTGNIRLTQCPANTALTYTVDAKDKAQGNPYMSLVSAEDGTVQSDIGIRFGTTADGLGTQWDVTGKTLNLGSTDANGDINIPVYATLVKLGDATGFSGKFSSVVTYTVNYK